MRSNLIVELSLYLALADKASTEITFLVLTPNIYYRKKTIFVDRKCATWSMSYISLLQKLEDVGWPILPFYISITSLNLTTISTLYILSNLIDRKDRAG